MKYTEITETNEKKATEINILMELMEPCVEYVNNKKIASIKKNKPSKKTPKPANIFIW
jgi:hypothetical protein